MLTLQRTLLIAGCFIFCIAILGMLYQEAIMVLLFTLLIPGPALGLIISIFKRSTIIQRIIFFLTACIFYWLAIFIVDIKHFDNLLSPTKIILASTLYFILLQLFFDLIFKTKINYKDTFIRPAVLGFMASILTTIAAFYFKEAPTTGWLTVPLWLGLFSFFPLLFFLFGRHLTKTGKVCS